MQKSSVKSSTQYLNFWAFKFNLKNIFYSKFIKDDLSLKKEVGTGAGYGYGSLSQRYGSADPEHFLLLIFTYRKNLHYLSFEVPSLSRFKCEFCHTEWLSGSAAPPLFTSNEELYHSLINLNGPMQNILDYLQYELYNTFFLWILAVGWSRRYGKKTERVTVLTNSM
jgi:hypothetical protein